MKRVIRKFPILHISCSPELRIRKVSGHIEVDHTVGKCSLTRTLDGARYFQLEVNGTRGARVVQFDEEGAGHLVEALLHPLIRRSNA